MAYQTGKLAFPLLFFYMCRNVYEFEVSKILSHYQLHQYYTKYKNRHICKHLHLVMFQILEHYKSIINLYVWASSLLKLNPMYKIQYLTKWRIFTHYNKLYELLYTMSEISTTSSWM